MGTVSVYNAKDEFTAVSLRDMLHQAGIAAMIQTNEIPGFGRLFQMGSYRVGFGDVLVNEEDEERARELVAGFLGTLGELAEMDEDDLTELAINTEPSEDELIERDEL